MNNGHATRRCILSAMAVIPVATLPATPAAASTGDWDRNLAAYRKADAIVSAFERDHMKGKGAVEAMEDRFSDLVSEEAEAFDLMFRTPAPHLSAVIEKLRVCVDDEMAGVPNAEHMAATLLEDLRRLTLEGKA